MEKTFYFSRFNSVQTIKKKFTILNIVIFNALSDSIRLDVIWTLHAHVIHKKDTMNQWVQLALHGSTYFPVQYDEITNSCILFELESWNLWFHLYVVTLVAFFFCSSICPSQLSRVNEKFSSLWQLYEPKPIWHHQPLKSPRSRDTTNNVTPYSL